MALCPSISYVSIVGGSRGTLPLWQVDVEVEVQVSIALVYMKCSFLNTSGDAVDGVFTYPASAFTNSTVCSCDVSFGGKSFSSSVVDPAAVQFTQDAKLASQMPSLADTNPKLFSMPFYGVSLRGEIIVELRFVQDLSFDSTTGDYTLQLPMTLPASPGFNGLYTGRSYKESLHYRVSLSGVHNSGSGSGSGWHSSTHQLGVVHVDESAGALLLAGDADKNTDFCISYNIWSDRIVASAIVLPDEKDTKGKGKGAHSGGGEAESGSFLVFLHPPSACAAAAHSVPRKVVFLIDQSYSMTAGTVMSDAVQATLSGLDLLQPQDVFAVCAFDNQERWFNGGDTLALVPATANAVAQAKQWVMKIKPEGGTDLIAPYKRATALLTGAKRSSLPTGGGGGFGGAVKIMPEPPQEALPIIVVITDGALGQEQDRALQSFASQSRAESLRGASPAVRTFAFGIGPYCNRYSLSQLADISNGHSEVCLDGENMRAVMSAFLSKTKSPVLVDIAFEFPSTLSVQTYPSSVPDLTVGAPVLVCGKYSGGKFPSQFNVRGRGMGMDMGTEGDDARLVINCAFESNPIIRTIVEKARLEVLVGQWYICANDRDRAALRAEAVKGSLESSLPCVFTQAVAYQCPTALAVDCTALPPQGFHAPEGSRHVQGLDARQGTGTDARGGGVGPAKAGPRPSGGRSGAGMAVGVTAAVVIATGVGVAFAFGNVSATALNLDSAGAMASLASHGFESLGSLCAEGWGAVAAVDWGSVGGTLSHWGEGVGAFAIKEIGEIGEFGSQAINAVSGALGHVGEFAGDAVQAVGGALGHVGEFAGDAVQAVGGALGQVGEFAGDAAQGAGEIAGGICGCLESILEIFK